MKFRYRKLPSNQHASGFVGVPLLQVRLINDERHKDVMALLDTGADDCMFHSSVAQILGIDLADGEEKEYTGIGGQTVECYVHPVELQVQGFNERIEIMAAFTEQNALAILGQSGFFDNYQVIIERYRWRFEVKSRTHLHAR